MPENKKFEVETLGAGRVTIHCMVAYGVRGKRAVLEDIGDSPKVTESLAEPTLGGGLRAVYY